MTSGDTSKVHIIGVGGDGLAGLTSRERDILQSAEVVFGSEVVLALLPGLQGERRRLGADLEAQVQAIADLAGTKRVAVVVGGDPLFYGVARYLCERLGKDHFEVLPHVSSMQLAFARVKESWEEAVLTNLQTHRLADTIERIRTAEVVGLFTSEQEGPREIARELVDRGLDYFRAYVCENLGGRDERVTQGELADLLEMDFAPLNIVILKRKPGRPDKPAVVGRFRRFGNPDDVLAQSRPKSGLITQDPVRCLALSRLSIRPADIVWDVGAGSGSVAIEAAQLSEPGLVFAIEQDAVDYHLTKANAERLGVLNVKPVHGTAPAVFAGLPAPDAAFIGAVSREMGRLVEPVWQALRPGGRLAINVGSLESLTLIYGELRRLAGTCEVLLLNVSRGVEQMETLRFEAVNPTFLLTAVKDGQGFSNPAIQGELVG